TRQKTGYIVSLARSILEGEIDLDDLEEADPVEARARLLSISGVGPWTADVYLLSALGHPDMFAVGDRALQVGTAEVLEMSEIPDISRLEILSETWRPIRAVAARLISRAYLSARGRVEPDTVNPYL